MVHVAYIMVAVLVIGNAFAMHTLNRKRAQLDLTNEAGQKKDKSLRLILTILGVYTVAISAVIIIFLKPIFGTISDY